jgi:hypothetical protein
MHGRREAMQHLISLVKQIVNQAEEKAHYRTSKNGKKFAILGDSDGDAVLFNGLLSTVIHDVDNWALNAVLDSQGNDGMFYRSPGRRETNNEGYEHFFSRDMSLGVMCAMTNIGFPESSAMAWMNYIDNLKKWWWPYYKFAPDSRSIITPSNWGLLCRVWNFRMWSLHGQMKIFKKFDGDFDTITATFSDLGCELHLKVVDGYIKYLISQSREYSQMIGSIAYKRQPDNLFYEFVSRRYFTQEMIERFIILSSKINFDSFGHSWIWEKSDINSHLSTCCGWDLVFMGKLILSSELNGYSSFS